MMVCEKCERHYTVDDGPCKCVDRPEPVKKTSLANDVCRCDNEKCRVRYECLRFTMRVTGGDRTPHAILKSAGADIDCEHKIGIYVGT